MTTNQSDSGAQSSTTLLKSLEFAINRLESARAFNKTRHQHAVLAIAARLLQQPDGLTTLYQLAPRLDLAGIFDNTDWAEPNTLLPNLVPGTFDRGDKSTITLEIISELRLLAQVNGVYSKVGFTAEQARHFLTQVLALNLNMLFGSTDEAWRTRLGSFAASIHQLFLFLLENIGFDDILGELISEIGRVLSQRPIEVDPVRAMVTQISLAMSQKEASLGDASLGADRLVSALFGPTPNCSDDPGIDLYNTRLTRMDNNSLLQEANAFARSMRDVGLVSDYHAAFIQHLDQNELYHLMPNALGLSSTGSDAFRTYQTLCQELIKKAIQIPTAQCIYGLSTLLESGILYSPPIAPALWRQLNLKLSPNAHQLLSQRYGTIIDPSIQLLAGVIALLGQPLGVGQGNNPTCQSARAISMWAYNDPDYLLQLIYQVACYDNVMMHFEGQQISSNELVDSYLRGGLMDTDPVSTLLVPHLDRIYHQMGTLCADRGEDPHRWINPEFHGWWVGREFLIAVDITTGLLQNYDHFIKQFYASYHPFYNGNQPIIHPQPAGIAITDSSGNFVGWHAITLIRVALDQDSVMRVYFFNPNNDSGQNWGNGVIVSTQGNGERFGEASLPFAEMLSRLYIFHDDPIEPDSETSIPIEEVEAVTTMALASWAKTRHIAPSLEAEP